MFRLLEDIDKAYFVGIYIRLSKEDENKNINNESESIENQKKLLSNYVKEYDYNLVDIYIDDGCTGTNFDRPNFKRMLEDIKRKKINMVITKDLSRLGRDYIQTGEFVEKWFPAHNVRYVALLDNIDTALDSSNNEIAPFKSLLNDMYAKDLSKKIRSALLTMQKEGKWVGGCPPFGYKINPNNKNHLIIDEVEGKIIKRIFKLFLNGNSIGYIAKLLNNEEVPTFSITRNRNFERKGGYNIYGIWSATTIKKILKNQLYTGDMVQNRRSRLNYKYRKIICNNEKKWIIVENTHEALVSKKDFETVQQLLPNQKRRSDKKEIRLLDGLLYCFECKHHIGIRARNSRGYAYMCCNYYRKNSKLKLCTSHGFSYDLLEKTLIEKVQLMLLSLNHEKIKKSILKEYSKNQKVINTEELTEKINRDINILKNNLDKIYMDKLDGKIDEDLFKRFYEKIKNEIAEKEKINEDNKQIINNSEKENLDELIKEYLNFKKLTRELILKLIKKIEVHNNKTIDVYFNFKTLKTFKLEKFKE